MRRERFQENEQNGDGSNDGHPINEFYNPRIRKKKFPGLGCRSILTIAYNVAEAFHKLHQGNRVMGNIKDSNILVSNNGVVKLENPGGPKAAVKFTPPECLGEKAPGVCNPLTPEYDLFGLGVLLFLLLMEGTYPFDYRGSKTGYTERIINCRFPYGKSLGELKPKLNAPPFDLLYPELQKLFRTCFEDGHQSPKKRPKVQEWMNVLKKIMEQQCQGNCYFDKKSPHMILNVFCPWCPIEAKIIYSLDQKSPQKTAQLARNINEKYNKMRKTCDDLIIKGKITSKLEDNILYWLPVIDLVVDFYIYEMILELKSKIQQYHGTFTKIDASFMKILTQKYLKNKVRLQIRIGKLRKLLKVALATNGIESALRLLAIYPFTAKARFWDLSKGMNKKNVKSFIIKKLS